MADWTYTFCDLLTGEELAVLPVVGVQMTRALNNAGTFSGTVPLLEEKVRALDPWRATEPRRTALYVERTTVDPVTRRSRTVLVWGGIVWGRVRSAGSWGLKLTGATFESWLAHRLLREDLTRLNTAAVDMAAALLAALQAQPAGDIGMTVDVTSSKPLEVGRNWILDPDTTAPTGMLWGSTNLTRAQRFPPSLQHTNRVPNPSLENDLLGWGIPNNQPFGYRWSSGLQTVNRVTGRGSAGSSSLQVRREDGAFDIQSLITAAAITVGGGADGRGIRVAPGQQLVASIAMMTSAPAATGRIAVEFYKDDGSYAGVRQLGLTAKRIAAAWTWQRITTTRFTVPAGAAFAKLQCDVRGGLKPIGVLSYFDGAYLGEDGEYFDGDTPASSRWTYSWNGPRGASTSTATRVQSPDPVMLLLGSGAGGSVYASPGGTARFPVAPKQKLAARVSVTAGDVPVNVSLTVLGYTPSGTAASLSTQLARKWVRIPAGETQVLEQFGVAGPDWARALPYLFVQSGSSPFVPLAAGEFLMTTAWALHIGDAAPQASPVPYFSGATEAAGGRMYSWTGPANSSPSVAGVAGESGSDAYPMQRDRTWSVADANTGLDLLRSYGETQSPVEFRVDVGKDAAGAFTRTLVMGEPKLGRRADRSGIEVAYPQGDLLSWVDSEDGQDASTALLGIGGFTGETRLQVYRTATDVTSNELQSGMPLLEAAFTASNQESVAGLTEATDAELLAGLNTQGRWSGVQVRADGEFGIGQYRLGDDATLVIVDPVFREWPEEFTDTVRIIGDTITPGAGDRADELTWTLGVDGRLARSVTAPALIAKLLKRVAALEVS